MDEPLFYIDLNQLPNDGGRVIKFEQNASELNEYPKEIDPFIGQCFLSEEKAFEYANESQKKKKKISSSDICNAPNFGGDFGYVKDLIEQERRKENRDRESQRETGKAREKGFVRDKGFGSWCLGFTPLVSWIFAISSVVPVPLVRGGMVVPVPFRRWVHVKHRNPQNLHGGFYCLLPIRGQRVIAAVARYRHGGQLEYKAYSMFVREYRDVLGLGDNLIWAVRDDLVKWLDALVHNSFVRYSTPDVDRCWYVKRISQLLVFAPTMLLPQGLQSSFEGIGRSTWILLRHGSKAWPIQVVDAVMRNGWREFRTTHGITSNYKLILMCERKWVFNAIILDQNDIEVSYN
ncbi:uncharacterized protein LOC131304450 [Rhododendron vialii]|uniref:uncharacterized protein LOC131304450 n=1 Tax=Rhododendron vialii TaxID=182163 RepID=UPI00265F3B4C|nr:uncharacterized protein LOC131304450 [Rhododendron vialii]